MRVKELVKVIDKYTSWVCVDLKGNIYYNIAPIMNFKVVNIYVKNYDLYNPLKGESENVTGLWIKIMKSGGTE